MSRFCRVVLRDATRAFDREYTYRVPEPLLSQIQPGCLVDVPFGRDDRIEQAFVIASLQEEPVDFRIKPLSSMHGNNPVLRGDQLLLAAQMRERYLCTYGQALRSMVPVAVQAVKGHTERRIELIDPPEAAQRLADGEITRVNQMQVVELLLESGSAPLSEVMAACQVSRSTIQTLIRNGWARTVEAPLDAPEPEEPAPLPQTSFQANEDQAAAIAAIVDGASKAVSGLEPPEYLLFGITGSGKTEVYLQVAQKILDQGRDVLILVPEIALTPQMIARIRARFPGGVAVLHSRLTPSERHAQWRRILNGSDRIVVGARSAVFAPLADIGLIVLDEEQESSYKSETHPRYHARDIARLRARQHGAAVVYGSATPSAETYQRTVTESVRLLTLGQRIGTAGLPLAIIVDMRRELADGNRSMFSRSLAEAMRAAFNRGNQAILFINRRGHSGSVLCHSCGLRLMCADCSVALTSHVMARLREEDGSGAVRMICHYCGRISKVPQLCPSCGSARIKRVGIGTQKVEEAFNQEFPGRSILRMDQDTTAGRDGHAVLLSRFTAGEADALVGTQMIAKGHDIANVTVVGIMAADLLLGISDFRAGERAFQLITQAAGRAGRGEAAGKVIIQAYNVDDYAVRHAAAQDYLSFITEELAFRRMMGYPPYCQLLALTFSAPRADEARDRCLACHSALTARRTDHAVYADIEIPPPARAPLYQLRGRFRWRLILKGPDSTLLTRFIQPVVDRLNMGKASLAIDPDPYQLI